jgi:uncharacterized protein YeaO (DUF488 family)
MPAMAQTQTTFTIKRIYDAASPDDGLRVLVDRLWPRGLRKEDAAIDLWLKTVTPSGELRKWIHAEPEHWAEFRQRYFAELEQQPEAVQELREMGRSGRVTLLTAAKNIEQNHVLVLREYLQAPPASPRSP